MPLVKQHNTWAQAAGKGLNSVVGNGPSISSASEMDNEQENSGSSASKVMRMEENVNESQIAAAFSEGWGQRGINQDSAWEVPSSPHLSPKEGGSTWTSTSSTGTEIWENSARHHIKNAAAKPPTQLQEPWGHTPTTHIGGTWGEEEDTTNLWTGVPQASGANWGGESNTSVWNTNPPPDSGKSWGPPNVHPPMNPVMPPNFGTEPPPLPLGMPHMPLANENKNIVEDSGPDPSWGDMSHKVNRTFGNWSPVTGGTKKLTPSGWEETAPPPSAGQSGSNFDDGTSVWGNPVHQGKVSRWKEMPPTKQMPNCGIMPPGNMCQGGNPCAPHTGPGMIRLPQTPGSNLNKTDAMWMKNQSMNRGLNWSEMPPHRDPSGHKMWDDSPLPDKGVPGAPNASNSAFGNWGEPGHPMGPYWGAKSKNVNSWADGQVDTSSWGGPMKQGGKPLSKDLIWASKQFRMLMEMNFKKDDIENALRRSNMNLEEALMELHALNNKDNSMFDIDSLSCMGINPPRVQLGNMTDDMNFSDHSMDNNMPPGNLYGNNNFPGMNMFSTGFNIAQNCKNQVPLQNSVSNNIAPNVLGNTGTNNQVPNFNLNNGTNNLSPAMMRKIFQQSQAFNPACIPQNTGRNTQQNFPSQLRHLVQQIQIAVQAGYLNPTILNQTLAPQTLVLLYQLLQQIRFLYQQQQMYFSQHGGKPGSPPLQLSVQITQTKQHIVNLQNQIAVQQAIFLKQQVQLPVQHPSLQNPQPSNFDVVKSNLESINGLHTEFRDLSVKEQQGSQGHSRLNQWKMSSFEKDDNPASGDNGCNRGGNEAPNDFSRAPGSITKSSSANSLASNTAPHSSSNLQPLNENTWSDMPRSQTDTWSDPNDSSSNSVQGSVGEATSDSNQDVGGGTSNKHGGGDSKDPPSSNNPSTSSSSSQSYNLNDLVPEFEPGKPWKGTSRIIKNFEDDPHVTPGSIAKSPLSLNSIKDSDLFTWNTTKQNVPNLSTASSLTSSTWTFSPPPSSQNSDSSSGRSGNSRSWNNSRPSEQDRMSWKGASPMPKTSRPPPGLSGQNKSSGATPNWIGNEGNPQGWSSNLGWEKQSGSNFLVLKNLTPQIDGSTLKTLCLQHGPLQLFHLLLNHGIALVRYNSREETEKACSALNNCVLSNTTILVDIPTEMEVKQYLQLANGQMASGVSWPPSGNGNGDSSYSSGGGNSFPPNTNAAANVGGNVSGKPPATANWNNSTSLNLQGSNLWSFSGSGNGLWAMQSSTGEHDPCIPSSLNSFLPGDLLGGGESI